MLGVVGELDRLRRLGNVLEIEAGQLGDDLEQVQSEAGLRLLPGSLGPSGTEEIFLAPHEDLCTVAGSQCHLRLQFVPAAEADPSPDRAGGIPTCCPYNWKRRGERWIGFLRLEVSSRTYS